MAAIGGTYLRMPMGFGPFPGPRQNSSGEPHTGWDDVRSTTATIVFKTSQAQLSALLPHPCFQIDTPEPRNDTAFASISFTRLENLPWPAGRGYNHCGLYIHDVACHGATEIVRGKYLSVLFENRADPIMSGREELGFAKVFAALETEDNADSFLVRIGWDGSTFGELRMEGLTETTKAPRSDSWYPSEGLLHFKYVPATGNPGYCDVQYPTFSPAPPVATSSVQRSRQASKSEISFKNLGFENLPTLHHIAERLAQIDMSEVVEAQLTVSLGAEDFRNQIAIQL